MASGVLATNYNLMEVTCQRSVADSTTAAGYNPASSTFSAGVQDFIFTIGRPNCINFSKSYFKFDLQLTGVGTKSATEASLQTGQLIALAYNAIGNMYTNCFVKLGGQDASAITSFLPQASALKKRCDKSHSWLDSVGISAEMDRASLADRIYHNSVTPPRDLGDGSTQYLYKGASNFAATVAIPAADGVVAGVNTLFNTANTDTADTQVAVGDVMVINGIKYRVNVVTSDTAITLTPVNAAAVAATTDFYFIRQNPQNTSMSKNSVSVLWQPPCGIFDCNEFLGAGDYKISLTPDANFRLGVVETKNSLWNVANGYGILVNDVKFYAYQAKSEIPEGPRALPLTEVLVMSKSIGGSNGVVAGNYQFSVPPSTYMISIFAQSSLAGSNNQFPPSMFKCLSNSNVGLAGDMTLTGIQLTYASMNKPSTKWASGWSANNISGTTVDQKNWMVQRYYDSYLEDSNRVSSDEGVETFDEWCQKGPFYHFMFARDVTDRSTELQLNVNYSNISSNSNIFIAAWYHNEVAFTVSQGLITALSTRQV